MNIRVKIIMRDHAVRILRNALCAFMMMLALGVVLVPQQALADDGMPWELEFLNLNNYKSWEIKPQTASVDNSNWKVNLNNASCSVPLHLDLSGFVGKGEISASVDMCTTADFEIEFKKANWDPGADRFEAEVTKDDSTLYRMDIFDTATLNEIVGWIPYVGNLAGVSFKKQIVGAATAPCVVKGKMTVKAIYKVNAAPVNGKYATAEYESSFMITSIEPKGYIGPSGLTVFVGDHEWLDSGFGKISLSIKDFDLLDLGPVLQGKAGIFAGNVINCALDKDQFDSTQAHQPEDKEALHTCADKGKPGCVSGNTRVVQQTWYDWTSHLRAEILGFELFDFEKNWGGDTDYTGNKDRARFYESLTYDEPLTYNQSCPHRVYRVPVGVWANEGKTIAIDGITVKPTEPVEVDPNVQKYTQDVSGSDGRGQGCASLYLPYKEGKYTIEGSGAQMQGSAEQPADFVRGLNDQVDIVVGFQEKRTLSVRKEWDIDYENKDRPNQVQVLLQAQYYSHGKNIWKVARSAISRFSSWEPVELATLNEANNWSYTFKDVPKYEIIEYKDGIPVLREIRYRIREMKAEESLEADVTGAVFDADDNGRVLFGDEGDGQEWPQAVDYEQALPEIPNADESQKKLQAAGKRVVHWRWDLDNVSVFPVIKNQLTSWDAYWQIDPNPEKYLTALAKKMFFPLPTVTYKVPAYTSSVGERIKEHKTKYVVEYSNEGETTVIKNTACLDIGIYKRWLDFDDEGEIPEKVWLVLQSRIKEQYLKLAGEAGGHIPYTPVFRPLYGNMTNLASIAGLDIVAKLDVAGLLNLPIAIGAAKKNQNPLISYRLKYGVRKYDLLTKLPLDFEAGELSSELIKSAIKAFTGLDIPVSISLTDGGYVTVPGKAFNLFKDWELTSNVINIMAGLDSDDDPAIGGTKYWKGEGWNIGEDSGDRLPEYLDIIVKDGDKEIGRVRLLKSEQTQADNWVWKLSQSDVDAFLAGEGEESGEGDTAGEEGCVLDPEKTYTITEEFPEDYPYKNSFVASIDGHNITNTWTASPSLVIEKQFEEGVDPREVQVTLTNDRGEQSGPYVLNGQNGYRVTLKNRESAEEDDTDEPEEEADAGQNGEDTIELTGHDINAFRVEEILEDDAPYVPAYSGPAASDGDDGDVIYTFTVDNRKKQDLIVSVEKLWEDESEDARPESIAVTLKRNGEAVAEATLSPDGDWKAEIRKDSSGNPLARLDAEGSEYRYTLEEADVDGYKSAVTSEDTDDGIAFTLTNTRLSNEDFVTVEGTKTWVDNSNADGARPESIRIHILADGMSVRTIDVSSGDDSWSVSGLPRYSDAGEEIQYSVLEESVDGYEAVYASPSFNAGSRTWTCNITNAYDTLQVTVQKVWEDDDDARLLRPESIEIRLRADAGGGASRVVATATLSADTGWQYVFTGLKREDRPGVPIVYTPEELRVPNYKSGVVSGSMEEGFTITNAIDGNMLTARVEKAWVDNDNADNTRPSTLTIHLLRDAEEYDTAVLSADNGWSCTFNDLPYDKPGIDTGNYEYTFEEDATPGYRRSHYSSAPQGSQLDWLISYENTLIPDSERMDIPVEKLWVGDGVMPESVTVRLMDGAREVRRLKLTEADGWQGVFENVPVYRDGDGQDGVEIAYTLEEDVPDGYDAEISGSAQTGFTVKNTWRGRARFVVTKRWDDDESLDRPASLTVYLKNGSAIVATAELTAEEGWSHTFTDLPLEEDGNQISYTVTEAALDHYEAASGDVTQSVLNGITWLSCTLTNRLRSDIPASFTVNKCWEDDNEREISWPEGMSVTVRLMQNGRELDSATLSADHQSHTFSNLPASDAEGHWYAYTVKEDNPDEYEAIIGSLAAATREDGTVAYSCEITNRRSSADINVEKKWDDDNYSGRPASVRIHLLANGADVQGSPVTLSSSNDWKHTFEAQPLYENGGKIFYTVEEDAVGDGYTAEIHGSAVQGFTIANRRNAPGKFMVTLIKNWMDNDDAMGMRPETLRVHLTRSVPGSDPEIIDSVDLNAEYADPDAPQKWSHTFINLDLQDDQGRYYTYSFKEEMPDGYVQDITSIRYFSGRTEITFTNTINRFYDYSVEKIWKDENGQTLTEGVPESVRINLMREIATDAYETIQSLTLSAENDWKGTFGLVPIYKPDGKPYRYSVEESPVKGYVGAGPERTTVDINWSIEKIRYTFTNTRIPKMAYTVEKAWDDRDDENGGRPESVTVYLLQGDVVLDTATLDAAGGWKHTFTDLDRTDSAGNPILYTVQEARVPFYEAEYTYQTDGEANTGCIVTNRYVGKRVRFSLLAAWEDEDDAQGRRPQSVNASIYDAASDAPAGGPYALSAGDGYAINDIPLEVPSADAVPPYYRAQQEAVDGYTTLQNSPQVIRDAEDEIVIRQTFTNYPEVEIRGKKTWIDDDNALGLRPDSITIRLVRSDGTEVASKEVTAEADWSWDFGPLPSVETSGERQGTRYTYEIQEDPVPYYTAEANGCDIINTWDPELIDIPVAKLWNDFDDKLGLRPDTVTVCLLQDNEVIDSATLDAAGEWKYTFEGLYRTDAEGETITYTLKELSVDDYTTSITGSAEEGFTITNALEIPTIDIPVTKVWRDDEEADGRPADVQVILRANGSNHSQATLEGASGWRHIFENLPVIDNEGNDIQYTVMEVPVARYHSAVSGSAQKGFVITNTPYTPIEFPLHIEKRITGDDAPEETFTFVLTPVIGSEGASEEAAAITGNGSGHFDLLLDQTGYYLYTLREEEGGAEGWTYDGRVHTILIEVTADDDGSLQVAGFRIDNQTRGEDEPVVFTNHYNATTIDVYGRKTWADDGDRDGKRPEAITINLLANDEQVDTREVTSADGWRWEFLNLPKTTNGGEEITYTIEEERVENYRTTYDGYNVTNTLVTPPPDTTPTTPPSITPTPTPDVTPTPTPEVTETPTPDVSETPTPDVTPTPEPDLVKLTVIKDWDESEMPTPPPTPEPAAMPETNGSDGAGEGEPENDGDGAGPDAIEWPKRPDSVVIHVYDGTKHVGEATLSEDTGWSHTFGNLPYRDSSGNIIPYTVTEEFVEGYEADIGPIEEAQDGETHTYRCRVLNTWTGDKTDEPMVIKKVKEKNDVTGIESEWQDAADHDIGDAVPFRLTGTLPTRFEKYEKFNIYTFTDRLPAGLSADPESVNVTKNGLLDITDRFDIALSDQVLTVSLKDGQDMRLWEGEYRLTNKDRIIVSYSAVLNDEAVIGPEGNPNAVKLTYTTESDGEYGVDTSLEDKVTVFTYTIKANKVDGDGQPLEGAGFTLYKNINGEWEQLGEEITDTTTFTFKGVDAGAYRLVETTVPEGYHQKQDLEITVIAYYDTEAIDPKLNILSVYPTDAGFEAIPESGTVSGDVINSHDFGLPGTGGAGTRGIYLTGSALLLFALLLARRRRDGR